MVIDKSSLKFLFLITLQALTPRNGVWVGLTVFVGLVLRVKNIIVLGVNNIPAMMAMLVF